MVIYYYSRSIRFESEVGLFFLSPIDVEPVRVIPFRLDGNTYLTYVPGG